MDRRDISNHEQRFSPHAAAERRAKTTAAIQAETGIDEAMIEKLVRGFYDRVRGDDLIGPSPFAIATNNFVRLLVQEEPPLLSLRAKPGRG